MRGDIVIFWVFTISMAAKNSFICIHTCDTLLFMWTLPYSFALTFGDSLIIYPFLVVSISCGVTAFFSLGFLLGFRNRSESACMIYMRYIRHRYFTCVAMIVCSAMYLVIYLSKQPWAPLTKNQLLYCFLPMAITPIVASSYHKSFLYQLPEKLIP